MFIIVRNKNLIITIFFGIFRNVEVAASKVIKFCMKNTLATKKIEKKITTN